MSVENFIGIMGEKFKIINIGIGIKGIEIVEKKLVGILVINELVVINSGRILLLNSLILSFFDGLVGILVDGFLIGENDVSGEIKVDVVYSIGMLSFGGDVINVGKIVFEKKELVGMYVINVNVINSGVILKGIFIKDEKLVGIYFKINFSLIVNKIVINSGIIDIVGILKIGLVGIYFIIENGVIKILSVVNNGNIIIN